MVGTVFDSLDPSKQSVLIKHLELVIEANKTTNLTRIGSLEEGMILHVEDSLSALPEILEAPDGLYADLGSGAGYPGIPLAVATGRTTLLVDSRQRKMLLVKEMIEQLGLSGQVDVYAGRAELLAKSRANKFSVITARALSKLSVLMELASPLLKRDGLLVCYKSHIEDEELQNAIRIQEIVGMKLESDRSFELENYDRRIICFKKISKPKVKLPRQEGQAQKNPL